MTQKADHMFRRGEGPDRRGAMRGRSLSSIRSRGGAIVLVATVAALAAACSTGTPSSSSSTTAGNTPTTASAASATASTKALQQALAQVGCYSGAIDGSQGPTTTAAIKAFQTAAGITVDGIYGPNTKGHLLAADKAGTKVCSSSAPVTTTTTAVPTTTTTSGSSASAPCTTAALGAALPSGDTLGNIQCAQGWAAGSATNSMYTYAFLLQSSNGVWVQPPSDACANATSLGIPSSVLAVSPCKVS
jgi:hypothetical protein